MSNEDTNETPTARLTDAQVAYRRDRAEWYATAYHGDRDEVTTHRTRMLAADVLAFADDRAALVADLHDAHRLIGETAQAMTDMEDANARLQARVDAALLRVDSQDRRIAQLVEANTDLLAELHEDELAMDEASDLLDAASGQLQAQTAQAAQMRPLVEALAKITPYSADDCDVYYCVGCEAESVYYDAFPHDNDCRIADAIALAATWQTPAAPTPEGGDHADD